MSYDLTKADWRTSTRSGDSGECVAVAKNLPGIVGVRDSKDPEGAALVFALGEWASFISGAKGGAFDL